MKKNTLIGIMALAALSWNAPAMADDYSPTASTEIFNFEKFDADAMLELFYQALQQGRNYPTAAEFEKVGLHESDIEFIKSHVRPASVMFNQEAQLNKTLNPKRHLFMNIPGGTSKVYGGYPSSAWANDVYSMWNYTNLFGSWNHGFFQAPGCWTDAAHKNGTDIMGGIKFFESWTAGSGDGAYSALIGKKNADGTYKYAEPLINVLMFFGQDGINYNWEDSSYSDEDVVAFHKELYRIAAEKGFTNYHSVIYTNQSGINSRNVDPLFGSSTGKTHDLMLNYQNDDFTSVTQMENSVNAAENAMGTAEGLYSGVWIVSMNRSWTNLVANETTKKIGICLWGEHDMSRFWSYNSGADAYEQQSNYQSLLERAFSGGNRNPDNLPPLQNTGNNFEAEATKLPLETFGGLATFIAERTAIQGNLPFATHFNLGNGDRYCYKGKKTANSWYNMSQQDVVPTYRWLVYNAGTTTVSTDIQPAFTHNDAYTGGSCLSLTGKATATGTDIVLYRTKLTVGAANPVAKVAVKDGKDGVAPTNLYVIVKKAGSDAWEEYAVGETSGKTWEEKSVALNLAQGDVIEHIGLRVKGTDDAYSLLVGKLELNDDCKATPANVQDVTVEVKEESQISMSFKLNWSVTAAAGDRAAWDLLYNDEANIDHFEVLYKNGEEGRVSEVGRTSQWATYIGGMELGENDQPYIGVRSVSTDLKTYSPIVWVEVPRAPMSELPSGFVDTYGTSAMDPACAGADVARNARYLTDVTTTGADQNLDYHADGPVADGSQYANALDHVLKVHQGQTVTLYIKAFDGTLAPPQYKTQTGGSDGLKWCFAGGWLDLNGSGTFDHPLGTVEEREGEGSDPEGERVFFAGTVRAATPEIETEGITATFTVPEDATPGKSRFRMVFADAWFGGTFLPVGLTSKGFSIDFSAEITGDNPGRGSVDTHDTGIADEPDGLTVGISKVASGEVSQCSLSNGALNFRGVEKAWIYSADGKLVKFICNPTGVDVNSYAPGVYVVRMQNGNVIRSQKFSK